MNYQQSWRSQGGDKKIKEPRKSLGKKDWRRFFSKSFIFKTALVSVAVFFIAVIIAFSWFSRGLPEPGQLIERQIAQSTKIYDRSGENILYDIHGEEQRTMIKLADIPEYVKWASISIEDKTFYEHKGISVWGILRGVVWQKLRGQRIQGGSTLTQQLVKNAILTSERKVTRKIKEWILSYKIEKKFKKDEILEMYLNEIPYGSTAYGIEAASRRFFGKSAKELSIAEAATLAALPQAPTYYSPYGSNREALIGRQRKVLKLMAEQGHITEEQAEEARNQELVFAELSDNFKAPHFVMYVKEILTEKYGEKMIEQGGLKIYTTLDLYKQNIAEEVITAQGEKNAENYNANNAALVSIDPKTGQILAMVGSRDYHNDDIDGQVNLATWKRQPGSSFKPIVYATLFQKGYTPNTILYDVVTNFSNDKDNPYEPHNYNLMEYGPVSVRKALAGSLNSPAVKAIYLAGLDKVLENAQKLKYSTLSPEDADKVGFSLVLGGAEVKLLEHTNAYSAFARDGQINDIVSILRIEDAKGNILEEWKPGEPKQVFEPNVARMINSIMSDNSARTYIFGERNWLTLGSRPVAAKTGTTNDYHDAWTVGYTPSIVTGVWVGNSDNTAMERGADGGVVAAPIWHDYMDKVLGNTPIEQFKAPEIKETGKAIIDGKVGETIVKIDKTSGLLATENTPPELIEEVVFRDHHSILYYVKVDDPLGPAPEKPETDPQFLLWEERVRAWAEKELAKSTSTDIISTGTAPTEYDNVHVPENIPEIKITKPENNAILSEPLLSTEIKTKSSRGIKHVRYYLNGNLFLEKGEYFYDIKDFPINFLSNGFHNLKIEACDDVYNCASESVEFNLSVENDTPKREPEISWIGPQNGLALNRIDFPLNIELSIKETEQIAKIEIVAIKDNDLKTLKTFAPVNSNNLSWQWTRPPEAGTYLLTAKAYSWSGQIKNSETVSLVINQEENK